MVACTASYDPEPTEWESSGHGNDPSQHASAPNGNGSESNPAGDQPEDESDDTNAAFGPLPEDHPALDVVRAWVRAETTAYRGGNRDRLRNLATSDCTACQHSLDAIAEVYADDGALRGDFTQTITVIQGVAGTNPPAVQTVIERSAHVLVDAHGEVRERVPASEKLLEFRTAKEGGRWLIADIVSTGR